MNRQRLIALLALLQLTILQLGQAEEKRNEAPRGGGREGQREEMREVPSGREAQMRSERSETQRSMEPYRNGFQEKPETQFRPSEQHERGIERNVPNASSTFQQSQAIRQVNQPKIDKWQGSKEAFTNIQKKNQSASNQIQHNIVSRHPDVHIFFTDSFFSSHHFRPFFHGSGFSWWVRPYWSGLTVWLGWNQVYPIYYDEYGASYQLNRDVYEDTPATSGPSPIQGSWYSLGVFAMGKDATQVSYSNLFIQLAIMKNGEIGGTYYNATTDQNQLLKGNVDPLTQQAVWRIADTPDSPIMSTGIYNLTDDLATVKVQLSSGETQMWVLSRVQ